MLKYGLSHSPTDQEVERWRLATERLIARGVQPSEAGRRAAEEVFPDCGTMFYKSEADTIQMLLAKAKQK
jgi:hypothetical protein